MKAAFYNENIKGKSSEILIMKILNFKKKMHLHRNTAHNNKELIKLGFRATVVLVCIFVK